MNVRFHYKNPTEGINRGSKVHENVMHKTYYISKGLKKLIVAFTREVTGDEFLCTQRGVKTEFLAPK